MCVCEQDGEIVPLMSRELNFFLSPFLSLPTHTRRTDDIWDWGGREGGGGRGREKMLEGGRGAEQDREGRRRRSEQQFDTPPSSHTSLTSTAR